MCEALAAEPPRPKTNTLRLMWHFSAMRSAAAQGNESNAIAEASMNAALYPVISATVP